ncbi:hypothetical protein Lalb_Chr15g0078201 [Lupinus albus]|uniref:Uncharacterized protein n=1 Tax=Lupinus albus TaxID=3870 RepID=A0A6A4PD83_LUPAL|nr:hypothetical protein Lalb_Chr15g0078201 [Lupinus albus]
MASDCRKIKKVLGVEPRNPTQKKVDNVSKVAKNLHPELVINLENVIALERVVSTLVQEVQIDCDTEVSCET